MANGSKDDPEYLIIVHDEGWQFATAQLNEHGHYTTELKVVNVCRTVHYTKTNTKIIDAEFKGEYIC